MKVNIVDATRRAVTEGKKLVRPWGERRIVIQPTDSSDCCLIWLEGNQQAPAKRWNPMARDLLAEDWEVME